MKVLENVRVLDLGSFITGPYAAMLLGDLGAEVIKIEKPGQGDPFRSFQQGNYSIEFRAHNRNKRSLTLDYSQPEGYEILLDLVRWADVLFYNARPGAAEHKKIDYATLSKINPRLIHCTISGFGKDGPYALRPAFDTVGQCLSGWITSFHDMTDPRIAGPAVCDSVTGMYAAYGVLGALYERERSGVGRKVEINMLSAMIAFGGEPITRSEATGQAPGIHDRASISQAFILTCRDGRQVGIHLSSPEKFWVALCKAVGEPNLLEDPRFATRRQRVDGYHILAEELNAIFARFDRSEWLERLEAADVPFAPVRMLDELEDDPQIAHLNPFYRMPVPGHGDVMNIHRPVDYDGSHEVDFRPSPLMGQHTAEILRLLGVDETRVTELQDRKIV
jgi:crotonobetainyl-CoA:carnitine CoA-transferase CaiB-like acyl-CoA transferase